jgi:hypothetical protein
VAVLHEGARQARARLLHGHDRDGPAPGRPAARGRAGRGAHGDRQLLLRLRRVPGRELHPGGRRLHLHRSGVLLGRAAGDDRRVSPARTSSTHACAAIARARRARASASSS